MGRLAPRPPGTTERVALRTGRRHGIPLGAEARGPVPSGSLCLRGGGFEFAAALTSRLALRRLGQPSNRSTIQPIPLIDATLRYKLRDVVSLRRGSPV